MIQGIALRDIYPANHPNLLFILHPVTFHLAPQICLPVPSPPLLSCLCHVDELVSALLTQVQVNHESTSLDGFMFTPPDWEVGNLGRKLSDGQDSSEGPVWGFYSMGPALGEASCPSTNICKVAKLFEHLDFRCSHFFKNLPFGGIFYMNLPAGRLLRWSPGCRSHRPGTRRQGGWWCWG